MNELMIGLQLVLSAFLGGVIGFVRERDKKAAGLRTHTLVCVGSTLLMQLSIYMSLAFPGSDPGRIAAQVVTGIGFLGAGTIIQSQGTVRGLTTAASIWVASAIGLAVGAGFYSASLVSTLIALIVLEVLRGIEKKYIRSDKEE